MTKLDSARQNLRNLLEDAAALKGFIDPAKQDSDPFNSAFAVAIAKARAAAIAYRDALQADQG